MAKVELEGLDVFHINDELIVKDARYRLLGVTYGSRGHFIATVRMAAEWLQYDGMKEYQQKGTGIQNVSNSHAPMRFVQSHSIYELK